MSERSQPHAIRLLEDLAYSPPEFRQFYVERRIEEAMSDAESDKITEASMVRRLLDYWWKHDTDALRQTNSAPLAWTVVHDLNLALASPCNGIGEGKCPVDHEQVWRDSIGG